MTVVPYSPLPFSGVERRVMHLLAVPSAPEVPEGSATSTEIFRAGDNFYAWLVFQWALLSVVALFVISSVTLAIARASMEAPPWLAIVLRLGLVVLWSGFACALVLTFLARRLNFRLRWYIVTDRSLRIRSGVFAVKELTMTYRNIQEIRVTAGLLQNALGLATVEVHAAGGGGDPRHGGGGHVGRLEGLSNATEIRDLLVERLRQYRDSGLGDVAHAEAARAGDDDPAALSGAQAVLAEVRALRAAIGG